MSERPELSLVRDPLEPETLAARAAMSRVHERLFGDELEPVTLGRYRIIRRLEGGSFGSVYSAFDPRLDRKVALKVFTAPPDLGSTEAALEEARAVARVTHPNVVTIYDAGRVGDEDEAEPKLFLSMEFVDGVSVSDWAAGGRSVAEILRVFREAADGLSAAHTVGLVHHDLKPSNLLVDGEGRVRVIDFGLARGGSGGGIRGTPHTMAPEQHRGERTDARTDIYGLAAACWWTLFGAPPFDEETHAGMLESKLANRPVARGRAVDRWVVDALRRALEPDRARRPASMREFKESLTPRWRRRWFVAAATSTLVVGGTIAGSLAWAGRRDRDMTIVESLTRQARDAAARAYFVYPPSGDPAQRSAYLGVVELERHGTSAAMSRAQELRGEFAETLVRLGDRYWEVPGGRPFAIDYYILATTFADHPRSVERALITAGELASLRSRAEHGRFTKGQLRAADALIALADPDPERRLRVLREMSVRDRDLPTSRGESLARIERQLTAALDPVGDVEFESEPTAVPTHKSAGPRELEPEKESPLKPVQSADEERARSLRLSLEHGREAFDRGDWDTAARHYTAALEHDARSFDAMLALSDVEYQRGRYPRALRWAERAAKRRPTRADVHLRVGDAARKTLDFALARNAYERAIDLGSETAASRLLRMDATER